MNYDLKAGFARVDITPPLGVYITGYFKERYSEGVLDNLELNCLAVNKDDKTVLFISIDCCGCDRKFVEGCKDEIVKTTSIDREAIYIHATHTHTGAIIGNDEICKIDLDRQHCKYVTKQFGTVAKLAIDDLKPAKMGYAVSKAEKIGFNRRYLMKDGSVRTNPGVNNPDIVKSIGLLDERVNVLRFLREDGSSLVLANYGNHPDTVGGNKISGDWPAFTRRIFEKAIDNTKCIFLNGAQGDINHVNVHPVKGDLNDMIIDFDDVSRGYKHAEHLGNVVAGSIMQVYNKVYYVDVDEIKYEQKEILIPTNKPTPEEMPEARYINEMHLAGRDAELPYKGMMLTTMVADAARKIKFENEADNLPLLFSAVILGKVAFFGIPGEPFTGIGIGIKQAEGFDMILPTCLTNSSDGYFPMQDSYEEGGYEARTARFKKGAAELIIEKGKEMLVNLKNK